MSEQTVLGVWDGHDAGAALVRDGVVVAAISEERFTRVKRQGGFPSLAIDCVLQLGGAAPQDVDAVAVAGIFGRFPARILDSRYAAIAPQTVHPLSVVSRLHAGYQIGVAGTPIARMLEQLGSRFVLGRRLADHGLGAARLSLVDHHQAHAASAACVSGGADALILTMDGYGDGVSTALWRLECGRLRRLLARGPETSLALLYGALTQILGFCEGEEGKVTALAALDRSEGGNGAVDLREYITVDTGKLRVQRRKALRQLRAARAAGKPAAALAAGLQNALERAVEALALHYLTDSALRRLSVAGGLFANVSLNRRLAALDLDAFTIFPAMTDQGLCVGAALVAAGRPRQQAMESVRLGPDLPITARGPGADPAAVAARLAAGEVLGVVRGRLEFGPRALGGRSILFDPRRLDVATRIGVALGRDRCMPFAPILLGRQWADVFTCARQPIRRASREMTLALPVRRSFAEAAPAAVHVDGTARPQAIDPGDDAWLVSVLEHFHALTGCCALINTSFNLHRDPIVRTLDDALLTAHVVGLDAVVLGDSLVDLSATHRMSRSAHRADHGRGPAAAGVP